MKKVTGVELGEGMKCSSFSLVDMLRHTLAEPLSCGVFLAGSSSINSSSNSWLPWLDLEVIEEGKVAAVRKCSPLGRGFARIGFPIGDVDLGVDFVEAGTAHICFVHKSNGHLSTGESLSSTRCSEGMSCVLKSKEIVVVGVPVMALRRCSFANEQRHVR